MGIPHFLSLIANNKTIIYELSTIINYLFIDANCILHCITFKNENDLITKFKNTIIELIDIIKPTNMLFIAIDGVVPFAKIIQQKKRRYNTLANGTKDLFSLEFSPGSNFMKKLHNELLTFIDHIKNTYNIDVIYTSYLEKGEGEHKIYNYIKSNNISNKNIVIYSADSDLVLLSCISKYTNNNNIYVTKYTQDISKYIPCIKSDKLLYFIDINALCDMLFKDINTLFDYIIIFIFVGNDFVPPISGLINDGHPFKILIDTYENLKNIDIYYRIFKSNKIDTCNFKIYIKNLLNALNNENINTVFDYQEYYTHCFGIYDYIEEDTKTIVKNYINGIAWYFNYYTNYTPETYTWHYPYSSAPLLKDILEHMPDDYFDNKFNFKYIQLTPEDHYKIIMPKVLLDECEYEYVYFDKYNKTKEWKHMPVITYCTKLNSLIN